MLINRIFESDKCVWVRVRTIQISLGDWDILGVTRSLSEKFKKDFNQSSTLTDILQNV